MAQYINAAESIRNSDFQKLCRLIRETSGIKITDRKKLLLEGRIRKRMLNLGISKYGDYCRYLFSSKGLSDELTPFIDIITTNKTDFFREATHFEFLVRKAIPSLIEMHGAGKSRPLRVWSAACSTGEEPYTLAMVISDAFERNSHFQYSILATDISTRVLHAAIEAVYRDDQVNSIPLRMKKKYLLRSKERDRRIVRIAGELRQKVIFRRLNLVDARYGMHEDMDIVFCRNVLIYFDRSIQEEIIRKISNCIVPGGFLFMGHSELLTNMKVPMVPVATSIYRNSLQ